MADKSGHCIDKAGLGLDRAGLQEDKAGHETDKPEAGHDKYAKKPGRRPVCFPERASPWGDGRGDPPPAIGFVVERFPPYNEYSDEEDLRFVSASRRAKNVDGGNSGKSRAAPGRGSFYP